jgi:hypothetical protein
VLLTELGESERFTDLLSGHLREGSQVLQRAADPNDRFQPDRGCPSGC